MQILYNMNLKNLFQILLILLIVIIIALFYFNFFRTNKKESITESDQLELNERIYNEELSNELINIEYNSADNDGNQYYINAERAFIKNIENENIINMEKVVSIINLQNKGIVNVYADNAIYNKINNNTYFSKDVRIEYLDNLIYSENLDLMFTDKISKVYNNVVFKNNNLNLFTDKISINMVTGNIKFDMYNNLDKVRLITEYEFIN